VVRTHFFPEEEMVKTKGVFGDRIEVAAANQRGQPPPLFNVFGDYIAVPMANQSGRPAPLFDKDADLVGYVLDSHCITWMFKVSMDADVIIAILRFTPEIV
jgi:hypothetical protein